MKCDICNIESNEVVAGRWIFYCLKHKENDKQLTMDNEITPDLNSGNMSYILDDGELQEILLEM